MAANITVETRNDAEIELRSGKGGNVELEISVASASGGIYDGEYTITPSDEVQILPTNSRLLKKNIVIEPIPSNYGHISWNGSVLTVW